LIKHLLFARHSEKQNTMVSYRKLLLSQQFLEILGFPFPPCGKLTNCINPLYDEAKEGSQFLAMFPLGSGYFVIS
jgi:hypothetical protein